ncbi:MAG: FAD-dependent monooxygenase [Burkholderiaceae bacterium]|nr:FAD-dependent monooxygenase [Burkholderiaceae bacterium]
MSDSSDLLRTDVAVVGRGAVGVAAALALSSAGLSTVLVGARPGSDAIDESDAWDLRVFALSPATRRLLESIGAWQSLDMQRVAPVYDMRVFPAFGSQDDELHFSAYESCIEALAWIVEQRNLMRALDDAQHAAGLRIVDERFEGFETPAENPAHSASAVPAASVRLMLEGGRRIEARLVVGADGAASRVRQAAGIDSRVSDYPQRALVAHFDTSLSHRDVAWQWFGEHGVLALLPLPVSALAHAPAGRVSMVWAAPHELADELQAMTPEQLAARVQRATGSVLGAMTSISRVAGFPLRLARSSSLVAPRVALVGDAAHVVHPLAGQGMNLGFGDVEALARTLRTRESMRDPGDRLLLRRYERARAEPVSAMRRTTDGLQRLFDPMRPLAPKPVAPLVRSFVGLGWRVVARSGWIRKRLVAQAVR